MTDEQINVAIATHCGWTDIRDDVWHGANIGIDEHGLRSKIPSYCDDLNAMAEAEKVLTIPQEKDYFANLKEIVGDLMWTRSVPKSHRATARQRAETFLLTLGKWSATDKDSLSVEPATEDSWATQGAAWPSNTRISKMNADGKWEEVQG